MLSEKSSNVGSYQEKVVEVGDYYMVHIFRLLASAILNARESSGTSESGILLGYNAGRRGHTGANNARV